MSPKRSNIRCPACEGNAHLTRRELFRVAGGAVAAAAAATLPAPIASPSAQAAPTPKSQSETLVATFYQSLNQQQRAAICFPFGHPKQSQVDNNWHITSMRLGRDFTPDQQAMVTEIFRHLHNPEFVEQRMKQLQEDAGGIGAYSPAIFGEPGTGKFEFVLTGRHCTVRCDGDSVEGAAFGGPIFYGHASQSGFNETKDHPGNVYWYQARRANEVFQALDGKQRRAALLAGEIPPEIGTDTVRLKGKGGEFPGLPVKSMSRDQRELVKHVLADLLLPFRKEDADEAMRHIAANGGIESLSLAFYSNQDIGNDQVWDVWRLEGPTMVWYFRGAPHVHVWVNIQAKA